MDDKLEKLERQIVNRRNFDAPPLHLWHPELSGDIDIAITADGRWYHEGGEILRQSIVRLFASILRREEDGEYYLLTPGEKWRIQVALHPLMVVDVETVGEGGSVQLWAVLNTDKRVLIGQQHTLFLEPSVGDVAALHLDHGLTALFSRAAWYRLVATAGDGSSISSGDYTFSLLAPVAGE